MNLGYQTSALASTVSIINSLDEVTREKVLAELPEELKRRLVAEQHAASILAAARLNLNANSSQQMLASGFLNFSTPETVVGHNINLLKTPAAGLAHTVLKTSAAGARHSPGIKTSGAIHNHGTPTVDHITTRLPGAGVNNMGSNPTQVKGTNAHGFTGSHSPGLRVSGASFSQSMNPLGKGITLSFGSKGLGASTSNNCHSFNPRMGMSQNTSTMSAAQQLGAATPVNMQMGLLPGNPIHLTSSHRFSNPLGSFPPRINGHLVRHNKQVISTYLDDFKQGFPSKGLSVVSNRWWGSAEPDKPLFRSIEDSVRGCMTDSSAYLDSNPGRCGPSLSVSEGKDKEANEVLKSCRKVTRSRRRAAVGGKRALQLGVTKGYGVQKLGHKGNGILQFVFGESLPRQWLTAFPASG